MTQQDIVNELNRMVVGYNINWQMIKYDADRAIMKINAHLGAEYPMMSKIMLSPKHRYVLTVGHVEKPIFPERYILTVVIPFIATEVLARDEEFTTIYNKYAMDFENGLFDMFQNEYNKVPLAFRQDKDVGVFFSTDRPEHKLHEDRDKDLPEFVFNVYYHFNFEEYVPTTKFTVDLNKYKYGVEVSVKDSTVPGFIHDIYYYEFEGWTRDTIASTVVYQAGDTIEADSDVHLYAKWNKICVLDVSDAGELSFNATYVDKVTNIIIPVYVDGKLVKSIASNFSKDATNLVAVTLPKTNLTIKAGAFSNTSLRSLILPPYDYIRDYPTVIMNSGAVKDTSIEHLYIPYSVATISGSGIKGVPYINCEIASRPSSWDISWTDSANIKWGVPNG